MNSFLKSNLTEEITRMVVKELYENGIQVELENSKYVPAGVSARHIHLSMDHVNTLFGQNYSLTKFKDISQKGQFAANEKVNLIGPKGRIEGVRILGPIRKQTQIELAPSDARRLGIDPPVRGSEKLEGTPGIMLEGPKGTLNLGNGCIIAERHIHMTPKDAVRFGVVNGQKVQVKVNGPKGGIMDNIFIKVRDDYVLDLHIDTDDANGFGIKNGDKLEIII